MSIRYSQQQSIRAARMHLTGICLAVLSSATLRSAVAQNPSYTATVYASAQKQTLEGFGTTLSWWANGVGAWSTSNMETAVDLIFAPPPTGLGLTYARYNIGGGECPTCHVIVAPHNVPGYESAPASRGVAGTYDWNADAAQRTVAKRAQFDGVTFFEAQSNSAPYWMTISGSPTGGVNATPNLALYYGGPTDGSALPPDSFPAYLASVVEHFQSSFGITFDSIDPFNEPDNRTWSDGDTKQEGCTFLTPGEANPTGYTPSADMNTVIQNLATALKNDGALAKVVAPDTVAINAADSDLLAFTPATLNALWEIDTHTYAGNNEGGLAADVAKAGKRIGMSEWGQGAGSGYAEDSISFARHLISDVGSLGALRWAVWQPDYPALWTVQSYTNASEETVTLREPYFAYANFTQWIRPGYQFLGTNDGRSLTAYDGRTNTLVIVTVNNAVVSGTTTPSAETVTYNLSGFTSVGSTMAAYQTTPTTNSISGMKLASTPVISGTSFTADLPASSITTFVIPNMVYKPAATSINDNAFTYSPSECGISWCQGSQSGAYDGDNHWSSKVGSYYTVPFNGTQAKVYAATSTNEGVAAYSVDNGPETEVDLYTSTRADNVLTYSTPVLASGAHTLKVRVTGIKNSKASSVLVNADRVDAVQ